MILRLLCAFVLVASSANAQVNERTLATELFNRGRELLATGDVASAAAKFMESARLDPKVGTLARLAECEEKLGKLAAARGHWQQSLNVAQVEHDNRADHVQRELARIDAIVPKLRVVLTTTTPANVTIQIDETKLLAGALGVPLPVEAGAHVITVTSANKKPWSTRIETTLDGRTMDVDVPALEDEVVTVVPSVVAHPLPAVVSNVDHKSPMTFRVVAGSLFGAGLIGVGAAIGFSADAISKRNASYAQGCVGDVCPSGAADTRDAARDAGTFATAFYVAGAILVVSGIVLWFVAPRLAPKLVISRGVGLGVSF